MYMCVHVYADVHRNRYKEKYVVILTWGEVDFIS